MDPSSPLPSAHAGNGSERCRSTNLRSVGMHRRTTIHGSCSMWRWFDTDSLRIYVTCLSIGDSFRRYSDWSAVCGLGVTTGVFFTTACAASATKCQHRTRTPCPGPSSGRRECAGVAQLVSASHLQKKKAPLLVERTWLGDGPRSVDR
jgi:hypothetical protein